MEVQARIGSNRITDRFGDNNGRRFRLSAETGGEINGAAYGGIIETFGRAYITDDGAARVYSNPEAVHVLLAGSVGLVSAIENAQRAKATLTDHIGAIENRHHAVTAKFVDVSTIFVHDLDLPGEKRADQREQFVGFGFLRKGCKSAQVGKADCKILFLWGSERSRL